MNDIACPNCGHLNPPGNRFCGACGAPMERVCPSCGTANPAGNRFCGSCGTALDEAPARVGVAAEPEPLEERKVVTSLFADLIASTEMAARLDPEDLRRVLSPFFDAMTEEIVRFGGTVEKFIGDAIVAFFGVPVAHEDDPERAVRAALAMQRRLEELNDDLAERAGSELAMRIGVNTGEVFAHTGAVDEGLVFGEAVNIAARFQALAAPGRVVVGERTWRAARHAFGFRPLDEVVVKGIARPLHAFEVEGEATGHAVRAEEAPFVGRQSEMELLRLVFARVTRERRPSLVTVSGPPGIGKSRLTEEFLEALRAEHPEVRVVSGRCLPYGDGLTYWPLAEMLRADAGVLDDDTPDRILDKTTSVLGSRMDGDEGPSTVLVLLSSIGVVVPSDPLAGAEPEAAQRIVARAWQRYLESLAASAPLVTLFEDVHWGDPPLLELIESVISRGSGPALVLCTARPDLFERRPSWGGGVANATGVALSPLSAGESAALLEHLLGGGAPPEVVGPILQRSEGNPFFATELLRMMTEDGTLAMRDGRWLLVRDLPSALPDTVQGVISSRIDLLAPAEKRAIQDASVIGRVFWQGAVERLGRSAAALDALIDKGLVLERDGSSIGAERELAFNHILTRDVAYASIPRAWLPEAHAAVCAWVEERTGGRASEFAEILAFHAEAAGDDARTARYTLLAGSRHLRLFAAEPAIRWLDRAATAAEKTGAEDLRAQVALARGRAFEILGRIDEARTDYERSLEHAQASGSATDEAAALAALAHALWLLDRYEEAEAFLPVALETARRVGDTELEARLLYTAGTTEFGRGAFEAALPFHEHALRVAIGGGDLEGQALAHHGLCETYFFLGPFESALEHGLAADRLLRDLRQKQMVAHNGYMVAWALGFVGRFDDAMETVEASIATSSEIGNRRDLAFALYDRAELELSSGRLGDAVRDIEGAMSTLRELGVPRGELIGYNALHDVLCEPWAIERIRAGASTALAISDALEGTFHRGVALAYAGLAALADGDARGAEAWFEQARGLAGTLLDVAWVGRVEVLAREGSGDAEALQRVGDRIEERVPPTSVPWRVWGTFALALAAMLREEWGRALELAERVVTDAGPVLERRVVWRAHRVAARALDALGRDGGAGEHRAAGREIVESIAGSAPEDLRDSFLGRPDVAELLEAP